MENSTALNSSLSTVRPATPLNVTLNGTLLTAATLATEAVSRMNVTTTTSWPLNLASPGNVTEMAGNYTTPFVTDSDTEQTTIGHEMAAYVPVRDAAELFHYYTTPCVALVGIICNVLALAVLLGTKLRSTSPGHYLIALAVADSVELLAEFVKWINRLSGVVDASSGLCKVVNHLRYSAQLWSAVLTTTITIERYIVVAWPLRAAALLTTTKAKMVIMLELMSCLTLGAYGSVFFDIVRFTPGSAGICLLDFAHGEAYSLCNLIISKVFGEIVTNILVTVFTGLIIKNLVSAIRFRSGKGAGEGEAGGGAGGSGGGGGGAKSAAEHQLTLMLVLVASAFVLLRSPYTITWYYSHYRWDVTKVDPTIHQALNVTYVIYLLNHAINFLLYNLSGSAFRGHLVALLCPFRIRVAKLGNESNTVSTRANGRSVAADDDSLPMSPRGAQRAVDSNANSRASGPKDDPVPNADCKV